MAKQGLSQHNSYLFIIGKFGHLLLVQVFLDAQILEQLSRIRFSLPAIHFSKLQFQVSCFIAIFLSHFRLRVETLTLFHVFPKGLMPHEYSVHYAVVIIFEVVLFKNAEAFTRTKFYSSLVGLQIAADGAQQR